MKKTDIKIGKFYVAEISGNLSIVKVVNEQWKAIWIPEFEER